MDVALSSRDPRLGTWRDGLEAGALLLAAPFLLFPTVFPVATAIACLLAVAVLVVRWARDGAAPVTPLNGPLALWGLMAAVGTAVSAFPEQSLPKATGLLLGAWVWLAIARMASTERRLTWVAWGVALLGAAIAGQGLLTTDWPTKVPLLSALIARLPEALVALPGGPEGGVSANQLGGAVATYLPLALSAGVGLRASASRQDAGDPETTLPAPVSGASTGETAPLRTLKFLGCAFCIVALVALLLLTQSRSAWIGGLVGGASLLALWAALLPSGGLRAILRIGLLVLVLSTVGAALWLGPERLEHLWQEPAPFDAVGGVGTLSFRVEVWRWALYGVMDFPFTGCGLGAFRDVSRLLYPMNIAPNYDIAHAHNIFLQVALDTGIPGLIAYLALLGTAGAMAWRVARSDPAHRPLALGLLGGLIALHAYGLTDALAPGSKPALIFWAMLGLITALHRHIALKGKVELHSASQQQATDP